MTDNRPGLSAEDKKRSGEGGQPRKGTRCAVCVMCGKCFEDEAGASSSESAGKAGVKWTGTRCEVCVGCGKCFEAWGLLSTDDADASSGPTNWGDAFKMMDTGSAGAPPPIGGAPGVASHADGDEGGGEAADAVAGASADGDGGDDGAAASTDGAGAPADTPDADTRAGQGAAARPSSFACLKRGADGQEPDTSTGATPGVSSACKEHGFDDMEKLIAELGIKPPGVA